MLRFLPKFRAPAGQAPSVRPLRTQLWRIGLGLILTEVLAALLNAQSYKLSGASLVWLPNGLLIGVLVSSTKRRWLPFLILGFSIDLAINFVLGGGVETSFVYAGFNSLEVVIASWLLYPHLNGVADLTGYKRLRTFLLYGVTIAPAITALCASLYLYLHDGQPFSSSWRFWFAADMLGIATITPLCLSYQHDRRFSPRSIGELIALFSTLTVVTVVVFGFSSYAAMWAVLIMLLLVGVRAGFTASALGLLIVISIGGYFTITGHGPLGALSQHSQANRMLCFQCFIAISMVALYFTEVAMTANRQVQAGLIESEARYRRLADDLELRVEERTGELMREIAERKLIQHHLENAKLLAEEANRAKSAFLANMSHELRTPLNAILGYSEMLEEEAKAIGNAIGEEDLRRIQKAGHHLLAIINDVLDLSKIESGHMDLTEEPVVVSRMVDEVVSTIEPLVKTHHNHLNLEIDQPASVFFADFLKFKQCLINLLGNACKFTNGGTITLAVVHDSNEQGAGMRWIVRDTGMGIAEKDQRRLFQAFSQVDSSSTRRHDGTGLGLVISQRLVQLMGGDIRLESEIGHGSTFTIRLPARAIALASEARSVAASSLAAA